MYVHQPLGFKNHKNPDFVFKIKKYLYGLKQAHKERYERISNFILGKDFNKGKVDTTIFFKTFKKDILVLQIYMDDIMFDANVTLCKEFAKSM